MMTAIQNAPRTKSRKPVAALPAFKYSDQLATLKEVFPDWTEDDLKALLVDLNGDAFLAVSRISEGHARPWTAARKSGADLTPTPKTHNTSPANRSPRNSQRKSERPANSSERASRPARPREDSHRRDDSSRNTGWSSQESVASPTVVPAEAAKTLCCELEKTTTSTAESLADASVPAVELATPEPSECSKDIVVSVAVQESDEEAEVVRMPIAIKNSPSLVMEQPAVILPIRAPMRTGLPIRFGFVEEPVSMPSASADEAVEPAALEQSSLNRTMSPILPMAASSRMTPISMAALESSLSVLNTKETLEEPEVISLATNAPRQPQEQIPSQYKTAPWSEYDPMGSMHASITTSPSEYGPAPGFQSHQQPQPQQQHVHQHYQQQQHQGHGHSQQRFSGYSGNARFSNPSDFSQHASYPRSSASASGSNVSQYYTGRPSGSMMASAPLPQQPANPSAASSSYYGRMASNRYTSAASAYEPHHLSPQPVQQPQTYSYHPHHQAQAQAQAYYKNSAVGSGYQAYNGYPSQNTTYYGTASGSAYQPHQLQQQHLQHQQQQQQQPYYQAYQPPHQYLNPNASSGSHQGHGH